MGGGAGKSLTIPIVYTDQSNQHMVSFKTANKQKLTIPDPYTKLKQGYQTIPLTNKKPDVEGDVYVVHGVVGLKNLGNTCYFNTAIHCLSHTQPLLDYFLSKVYEKEINKSTKLGSKGQVTECFASLLFDIWKDERSIGISHAVIKEQKVQKQYENCSDPTRLLNLVQRFSKRFETGQQEDCQELLSYLLDIIHEDLNRCQKKQPIQEKDYIGEIKNEWAAESWGEHLKINKSIVVDLFQGQLMSNVRCNTCQYQSHKWEPFLFLNLPIKQQQVLTSSKIMTNSSLKQESVCQLTECLELFQKEETIHWKCPKCKETRESSKGIRIWKLPTTLIIHLKRFEYGTKIMSKIQTKVEFPIENLDMSPYCVEQGNAMYNLYAVAQHHGTLQFGHYVAVCKHRSNEKWFMYNDDAVYQIQDLQKTIVNEYAYVLFYQQQTDQIFRQTTSDPSCWPHNLKTPQKQSLSQTQTLSQQFGQNGSKQQTLTLMDYEEAEQKGQLDLSPRNSINLDNLEKRQLQISSNTFDLSQKTDSQNRNRKQSQNQVVRELSVQSNSIYKRSKLTEEVRATNQQQLTKLEQDWGFGQEDKIQQSMNKKVENKFVEMRPKGSRKQ